MKWKPFKVNGCLLLDYQFKSLYLANFNSIIAKYQKTLNELAKAQPVRVVPAELIELRLYYRLRLTVGCR